MFSSAKRLGSRVLGASAVLLLVGGAGAAPANGQEADPVSLRIMRSRSAPSPGFDPAASSTGRRCWAGRYQGDAIVEDPDETVWVASPLSPGRLGEQWWDRDGEPEPTGTSAYRGPHAISIFEGGWRPSGGDIDVIKADDSWIFVHIVDNIWVELGTAEKLGIDLSNYPPQSPDDFFPMIDRFLGQYPQERHLIVLEPNRIFWERPPRGRSLHLVQPPPDDDWHPEWFECGQPLIEEARPNRAPPSPPQPPPPTAPPTPTLEERRRQVEEVARREGERQRAREAQRQAEAAAAERARIEAEQQRRSGDTIRARYNRLAEAARRVREAEEREEAQRRAAEAAEAEVLQRLREGWLDGRRHLATAPGVVGSAPGDYSTLRCDVRPESIERVRVWATEIIHGLGVDCRDPSGGSYAGYRAGPRSGPSEDFVLEPDERIIGVSGSWGGGFRRGPFVTHLQIHTNRRSSPVFGEAKGGSYPFRFDIPDGLWFRSFEVKGEGPLRQFNIRYYHPEGTAEEVWRSPRVEVMEAERRGGVDGAIAKLREFRAYPATANIDLEWHWGGIWDRSLENPEGRRRVVEAWMADAPESWYARMTMSETLGATDPQGAIRYAEEALELAPWEMLAIVAADAAYRQDATVARIHLQRSIAEDPEDAWALTALARLDRDRSDALGLLQRAVAADDEAWLAHAELGSRMFEAGDEDRAFDHYRRALELHPGAENPMITSGYAALGAGDADAAIRLFELVIEVRPASWNGYDSLADVHARAGNRQRAIELSEMSLQHNPDNEAAKERIAELRRSP